MCFDRPLQEAIEEGDVESLRQHLRYLAGEANEVKQEDNAEGQAEQHETAMTIDHDHGNLQQQQEQGGLTHQQHEEQQHEEAGIEKAYQPPPELEERNEEGHTLLAIAALRGQYECVGEMLSFGANPDLARKPPVLHAALQASALPGSQSEETLREAVKQLIEHGAMPDEADDDWQTPVHYACSLATTGCLEDILARGGDRAVDHQDREGRAPLHVCAALDKPKHARVLLGAGAWAFTQEVNGRTPLHVGAREGTEGFIRGLLDRLPREEASQLLESGDRHSRTPARIAALAGHSKSVICSLQEDGDAIESADAEQGGVHKTIVVAPWRCNEHHTCMPPPSSSAPPENVKRLYCLTGASHGALRSKEFADGVAGAGREAIEWMEQAGTRELAPLGDILRVHEWQHVKRLQRACEVVPEEAKGEGNLDNDTHVSRQSFEAALAAAQAGMGACETVVTGGATNAFCAVRPPGHHAGPSGTALGGGSHGFCLLSNAALAAAYARSCLRLHGIKKVCVIDWDVHHGNGTEACFRNTQPGKVKVPISLGDIGSGVVKMDGGKPILDPDEDADELLFASVHGFDGSFYPATGVTSPDALDRFPDPEDRWEWVQDGVVTDGRDGGEGRMATDFDMQNGGPSVINVGMRGTGSKPERGKQWRRVWKGLVLPRVYEFNPDLIIISAGFDAHMRDSIQSQVNLGVREADYEWLSEEIAKIAYATCSGRIVSMLEGGYRVQGGAMSHFAKSVASHLRGLQRPPREPFDPDLLMAEVRQEWQRRREAREEAQRAEQERLEQLRQEQAQRAQTEAEAASPAIFAPNQPPSEHPSSAPLDAAPREGGVVKQEAQERDTSYQASGGGEEGRHEPEQQANAGHVMGEGVTASPKRRRTKEPVDYQALNRWVFYSFPAIFGLLRFFARDLPCEALHFSPCVLL